MWLAHNGMLSRSDVCHFQVQALSEGRPSFALSLSFCQLDAKNSNTLGRGQETEPEACFYKWATPIYLHIVCGCFPATIKSSVIATETLWPTNIRYLLCGLLRKFAEPQDGRNLGPCINMWAWPPTHQEYPNRTVPQGRNKLVICYNS